LPATGKVKISVYNQLGQLVKTITDRVYPAGSNEILFNGENLPSGVYFYRIESGTFSETKKMVLLK
jgi:flagellar hook assembly protein FlgD